MNVSIVLTAVGTVMAIMGSNMMLFLWSRAESRSDHRMMLGIIDGIQKEIKDFHGRLERQDAEFKGKIALIEERYWSQK